MNQLSRFQAGNTQSGKRNNYKGLQFGTSDHAKNLQCNLTVDYLQYIVNVTYTVHLAHLCSLVQSDALGEGNTFMNVKDQWDLLWCLRKRSPSSPMNIVSGHQVMQPQTTLDDYDRHIPPSKDV